MLFVNININSGNGHQNQSLGEIKFPAGSDELLRALAQKITGCEILNQEDQQFAGKCLSKIADSLSNSKTISNWLNAFKSWLHNLGENGRQIYEYLKVSAEKLAVQMANSAPVIASAIEQLLAFLGLQ